MNALGSTLVNDVTQEASLAGRADFIDALVLIQYINPTSALAMHRGSADHKP